jgi:cysteinyl-tRNA synthetase
MDIYLHNTLSLKKELFTPIVPGAVSMYNCGPTVYHYAHIGNMRSYVFADTIKRMFVSHGYTVNQVINITDVGHLVSDSDDGQDKMEKGALREGKTVWEIADMYTQAFFSDLEKLNIERQTITFPKATDYIAQQIEMIQALENNGYTYTTTDGVYFDTKKFPEYGMLGHINLAGLEDGARIGVHAEKRNPTDFALWKFSPKDEQRAMEWTSPWGIGFPGWHIECSAMSKALLGDTFDLHTGGIDHIPVHHNNEIAQSVCANKKPFVHYWMHNAHLTVSEGKMAKSGDNFITIQTLEKENIDPVALRYLFLTARYSSPLQFSWEALKGAEAALKKLRKIKIVLNEQVKKNNEPLHLENPREIVIDYKNNFLVYVSDDLDTPKALALVWEIVKNEDLSDPEKRHLLWNFDKVLGLNLDKEETVVLSTEVADLVAQRDTARAHKDFALSDELRTQIENLGFTVSDTDTGTQIEKK